MQFEVDRTLLDRFPGLVIGVVVGRNLLPPAEAGPIQDLLTAAEQDLRREWAGRPVQEHPRIAPWRETWASLGLSARKYPSSIEALARRVLSGRPLPRISPLVDLYNAVSLRYRIPMGGHDADTFVGAVRLGPTRGGEPFRPMFSQELNRVEAGEIAYMDGAEVLTRHWAWRQCHKDRITPQTRSVFIPIDGLPVVGKEVVRAAAEEVAAHLQAWFGAEVWIGYATAESPLLSAPFRQSAPGCSAESAEHPPDIERANGERSSG